jgi:hypothetical protein
MLRSSLARQAFQGVSAGQGLIEADRGWQLTESSLTAFADDELRPGWQLKSTSDATVLTLHIAEGLKAGSFDHKLWLALATPLSTYQRQNTLPMSSTNHDVLHNTRHGMHDSAWCVLLGAHPHVQALVLYWYECHTTRHMTGDKRGAAYLGCRCWTAHSAAVSAPCSGHLQKPKRLTHKVSKIAQQVGIRPKPHCIQPDHQQAQLLESCDFECRIERHPRSSWRCIAASRGAE